MIDGCWKLLYYVRWMVRLCVNVLWLVVRLSVGAVGTFLSGRR